VGQGTRKGNGVLFSRIEIERFVHYAIQIGNAIGSFNGKWLGNLCQPRIAVLNQPFQGKVNRCPDYQSFGLRNSINPRIVVHYVLLIIVHADGMVKITLIQQLGQFHQY
jgi:hypothetical protein